MDEFVRVIQASSDSFSDPTRWVINENEQENVKYIEELSWNLPIVGSILSCFMLQNRSQLIRSPTGHSEKPCFENKTDHNAVVFAVSYYFLSHTRGT